MTRTATIVLPWTCTDDCTHFTSCCIGSPPGAAGGGFSLKSRLGAPPNGPYGEPGAGRLASILKGDSRIKVLAELSNDRTRPSELERGDVIVYYNTLKKKYTHAVVLVEKDKVAAHTPSRHPSSTLVADWDYKGADVLTALIYKWSIFHFRTESPRGARNGPTTVTPRAARKAPPKKKPVQAAKTPPKPDRQVQGKGLTVSYYTVQDIKFMVGVLPPHVGKYEALLNDLAAEIVKANTLIGDPDYQVKTCVITIVNLTDLTVTFQGKPTIVLDTPATWTHAVVHEMGHALFNYYRNSPKAQKKFKDVPLSMAELYVQLKATKLVQDQRRSEPEGGPLVADTQEAGFWIADPSQWSQTIPSQVPWRDLEELFASAREAVVVDRSGFEKAIKKFTDIDAKVKVPAKALLDLLDDLQNDRKPSSQKPSADAKAALQNLSQMSTLEDFAKKPSQEYLRWTLDPDQMPALPPAGPDPNLKP